MNSISVEKLNPSSDIWYKDCFNILLYSIISYYDGNIFDLLLNSYYIYEIDENNLICLKEVPLSNDNIYKILLKSGIECQGVFIDDKKVVDQLIAEYDKSELYIIGVDSFYEEIRRDTYNKEHLAHALLIYGIDTENENVNIFEHTFRYSSKFTPQKLSFENLRNAVAYFRANVENNEFTKNTLPDFCRIDEKFPCYFKFKLSDNHPNNDHNEKASITKFSAKYKEIIPSIIDSIKYIGILKENFDNMYRSKNLLEELIDKLNKLIINKKVEYYAFNKAYKISTELQTLQNDCILDWTYIRSISAKSLYSEKVNEEQLSIAINKFNEIIEKEINYYTLINEIVKEV